MNDTCESSGSLTWCNVDLNRTTINKDLVCDKYLSANSVGQILTYVSCFALIIRTIISVSVYLLFQFRDKLTKSTSEESFNQFDDQSEIEIDMREEPEVNMDSI